MAEAAKMVDGRLSVFKYDDAYKAMLQEAPEPPVLANVKMPEPTLYQYRMKPDWEEWWYLWTECSEASAEDYIKTPHLNGWSYEVRKLYLESQLPIAIVKE